MRSEGFDRLKKRLPRFDRGRRFFVVYTITVSSLIDHVNMADVNPLDELKHEHPKGEFIVSLEGFPDRAAACFGEPGEDYVPFFFGGHSGDFEKAMTQCDDQLKCAGFITTAKVLFPNMEEDMAFEDFFSLIDVEYYEYFGEETITAEGWLRFMYDGMEVMVNTNEAADDGGWDFTGVEIVKGNAPISIVDLGILHSNQDLAEAVMFD